MIALDTNVVVRLLTNDDPSQAADALHLASAAEAGAERIATFDGRFLRLTNAKSLGVRAVRP